jgi:hypothetical protein
LLVLGVMLVIATSTAWMSWRASADAEAQAFDDVAAGETAAAIRARLGDPTRVGECGEWLWWGGDANYLGRNEGRCVSWWRYERFLLTYGIGFDRSDRVISKYRYVSE